MDRIAVINATTLLTDADVRAMTAACQTQITRDFYPAWGVPAALYFVARGARPPRDWWWLSVLDDADAAHALGYHDITPTGQPLGKVFVRPTLADGVQVSGVLSHELLEMCADPDVNLLVQDARDLQVFWAYEVCDAVQSDALGYRINNILVSDFVLPEYFETFRRGVKTDFLGHLTAPVATLAPGGYMAYVKNGRWQQVLADGPPSVLARSPQHDVLRRAARARPHEGSRRWRRFNGRDTWLPSVVDTADAEAP